MPIEINYDIICDGCGEYADTSNQYYLLYIGWKVDEYLNDNEPVLCPVCLAILEKREENDKNFKDLSYRDQLAILRKEKAFPDK